MTWHLADLNADVLASICTALYDVEEGTKTLRAFSSMNRRIRHASLPPLFRSVSVPKKPLRESTEALVALKETNSVTRYIRVFTFSPLPSNALEEFLHSHDPAVLLHSFKHEGPDCASALVEALASMPSLENLTFQPKPNPNLRELVIRHFPVAFAPSQLRLERVKYLSTDVSFTFLRRICPSAVALSVETIGRVLVGSQSRRALR
ncbi:hypothetical protein EXIGLDRAFT_732413 [Exidia glandulosa HHB12029]|uniref:F-box domain-containing protein n=1 Tax=Exidia glandulosa HHB12029 TaxID=1314781 RepID=A0A165BJU3_EXIGL|nr:hypothetical protein EXIGLDRAFT_732413 [Exidia glandulosa HHB12029]